MSLFAGNAENGGPSGYDGDGFAYDSSSINDRNGGIADGLRGSWLPPNTPVAPRSWLSKSVLRALEDSEKVPVVVGREYIGIPSAWCRDFEEAVEKVAAGCTDSDLPCVPAVIDLAPHLMPPAHVDGVAVPVRIRADKVCAASSTYEVASLLSSTPCVL